MSTHDIQIEGTVDDALTKLNSASKAAIAAGKCLVWRAIADFICYRALQAAEAELMALDDRMLKDIGLDRSEIKSVLLNARQDLLRRRALRRLPDAHAAAKRGTGTRRARSRDRRAPAASQPQENGLTRA